MIARREISFEYQTQIDRWFMVVTDVPSSELEATNVKVEDLQTADLPEALRNAATILETLATVGLENP